MFDDQLWAKKPPLGGFFTFRSEYMKSKSANTDVFIDGYNLYYGCLRNTAYKWLDVCKLSDRLVRENNPSDLVRVVNYFTANALGKFASHGQASVAAQQAYHRALSAVNGSGITISIGRHAYDKDGTLVPEYIEGAAPNRNERVKVWRLEEKETDVHLALQLYRSASRGGDQIVLVSNDSDFTPALRLVREDFPQVRIGVVTPVLMEAEISRGRSPSNSLRALGDWHRTGIRSIELEEARLPERIPTRKRPILCPPHWR